MSKVIFWGSSDGWGEENVIIYFRVGKSFDIILPVLLISMLALGFVCESQSEHTYEYAHTQTHTNYYPG